jgi:valyl-tRNA synthetase
MPEIPKTYDPKSVEDKWYAEWTANCYFTANPASEKNAYSIVIPPPNVTGVLTMGHVLNNTIQDILARRKRMQGYEVLWLPGTDHAGIATQTAVEKALKKQGIIKHRNDLGREKFLEKIWEWKEKHGGIIIQQLKKLGCSCDWTRERFTMDEHYSRCISQVFVDLYKKGYIYRGKRMVNWDVVSQSALSDEEVVMKEVNGNLWYLKYPLIESHQPVNPSTHEPAAFVVVATTRPETMLGDEAVAVNPDDPRYKNLIGKKVLLPLQNKTIPIIADSFVDPKFGTGCVKVTPAHDPNDYEMGVRHKLPFPVVIGADGKMTDAAGEKYKRLDRFECRKQVVADLEALGLIEKIEPHTNNVGYSERTDVPIEPFLSEQWFFRYCQVERSTAAVEKGEIKFYPERWEKVYSHWMHNIKDWCISRQLWWGHRIPVWYRGKNELGRMKDEKQKSDASSFIIHNSSLSENDIYVGINPPPDIENWTQDPDVLDTWFSSWLWPFATMGWELGAKDKTPTLKKFYPTTDLVTAPDIIFFWVARMIMAGYEYMGEKPFSNVYFTGIIRDHLGRKMSKSLGNSPDPLDLIAKYGADGLRFGLMLIAPQGQDIRFDEKQCELGRNFMNKLWNAARFIQMQRAANPPSRPHNAHDLKILFEMNEAIRAVNQALDHYEFNVAAKALYDFVWGDFCDWYIEASKASPNLAVLDEVFSVILRLLHPFAPFITEELWNAMGYGSAGGTIQFAPCPQPREVAGATAAHAARVDELYALVTAGRQLRNDYGIEPKKKLRFAIKPTADEDFLRTELSSLILLLNADEVAIDRNYVPQGVTPSITTKTATLFMVGAVDAQAERKRLQKQLDEITAQLTQTEAKLKNENFIARAKPEAVEKERERQRALTEQRQKVESLLTALK